MRQVQIGDCTLIQADCLDILPTLGKVDCVIADPPYAMTGGISNGMTSQVDNQFFEFWFTAVARELIKACKPHAAMALWCDWRSVSIFDSALGNASDPYKPWRISQVVIHDREMIGLGSPFRNQCDWIAIARGPKTDFGQRIPNNTPNIFREYSYYGKHDHHPAEKTVSSVKRFIGWLSDIGNLILDPTMGSGTTGVGCVELGRKFIGIEKTPRHFDTACQRIEEAYRQPYLFDDMFVEAHKAKPVQEALF